MPPKDSAAKKKSRAEVREELRLALQQRWQRQQQPSQPKMSEELRLALQQRWQRQQQPSQPKKKSRAKMREELRLALQQQWQRQQQPSQALQPSQNVDGPSGSQQELPVLPQALPTPSTHSTTGSKGTTGLAPPIRSIRCTFVTTHLPTESGTAGASSSNTSDGFSQASVTTPLLSILPVDVEIGVMERVIDPLRGTRVPGLSSGVAKQPRRRGPSQPAEPRNEAVEEELARLRANQKNLEERLQQQEREYEMECQERERERQERERERLVWEARMQAQFEEMARQMRLGAPPSNGPNSAP